MKLIRFGVSGKEKIGVQIDGVNYDVSAFGGDYNEQFFADNGWPVWKNLSRPMLVS